MAKEDRDLPLTSVLAVYPHATILVVAFTQFILMQVKSNFRVYSRADEHGAVGGRSSAHKRLAGQNPSRDGGARPINGSMSRLAGFFHLIQTLFSCIFHLYIWGVSEAKEIYIV
ncbi:hypothetical protein M9H77_30536 [Catharanthus roseus]|uniref:Uncharacterized protein n=1 Tax=Catharanthus roseus TaxID=4058 RepID=A0ACB9ZXV7_CATRO|nr:hypothetical protein M9H77_30536 [Catharanthus roseus]